MSAEPQPLTPLQHALDYFTKDTAEHEMEVLMDTGLHRHLRFNKPGTSMYWFDIHTAPGLLTFHGDMGTYVFSRERDMFDWFGGKGVAGGINAHYWAEKLQAPKGREGVKVWSEDKFKQTIEQLIVDEATDLPTSHKEQFAEDFRRAMYEGDTLYMPNSPGEAMQRLDDYSWEGAGAKITFEDVWDHDFQEYDFSYLWCCYAVVWGIEKYRASQPSV